mmetsp:Transcript_21997/g.86429  ORF Transcript_21997/g.86429 Transcript_21997/m.86429 type:complete len:349 (-) Transcript_21997:1067-2113(-)
MTGAQGVVVVLMGLGNAGTKFVCRAGLARAGDVVQLTLDGQQGRRRDVLRPHEGAIDLPGAVDQCEVLEHGLDGVEVVLSRHVEHGVVFVVEPAVRLGTVVVAAHQVEEVVVVRGQVPVRVHCDEAGVLQEARVDLAAGAREVGRHAVDHVVLEPAVAAVHGQVVDGRRALAGVDGAAHHRHAARRGFSGTGHQRDGRQHGHGRLADRHHMAVGTAHQADELLHVMDVVVQVEGAHLQRHHAGIGPVGDVDLVVAQQLLDGFTQQRAVMAGQRGHHEHGGLVLHLGEHRRIVGVALEAQQPAEGLLERHELLHRDVHAVDLDRPDLELGLLVVLGEAVHQVQPGGQAL